MKKTIFVLAIFAFVLCGCSTGSDEELNALQTQVAVLSESDQGSDAESVDEPAGESAEESADYVVAQSDESAFALDFSDKLTAKGWTISNVSDNSFGVTTPNEGIYLIQYDYQTAQVSRVMIYSLWTGVGTSNLNGDVLSIVNQANDEQFLAKISVDTDGDFWLETVVPFEDQLDVNFFCNYLEWFEDNEVTVLLSYFKDYLQ